MHYVLNIPYQTFFKLKFWGIKNSDHVLRRTVTNAPNIVFVTHGISAHNPHCNAVQML
jgi:hypothetical protein